MDLENLKYEDNQDFNQSLDSDLGTFDIYGERFLPSEILYNLKKEAYRIFLTDFENQQFDELKQIAFDEFPSCIAYNFRLSEKGPQANNPINKFLHLKDTWEAAIFVLYALTFGEVRAKGIDLRASTVNHSGNPTNTFNTNVIMSDALKQKIENIRAVVNHSKANALNLKCEAIDSELLDSLYELQNNRNHFSHMAAPTAEQASAELTIVNPLFKKALKRLKFLEEVSILRFDSFTTQCRFETFKGHALNKEFEEIPIDAARLGYVTANAGQVMFAKWDNEIFSLSPFLHFVNDGTGHETYLSVYKGKKNGEFVYEPVKLRAEQTFVALQPRFDAEKVEIKNLIQ